ncbi:MAG TPA: hypothetical protein VL337_02315 [Acidimicrobiales bacterium]|jgi:hypothetical protein|nr:hypothetical protein [Acidimicrobiales bacterium]
MSAVPTLKRLTATGAAAVALAAALTACGGGVSKPSFVAKADGACAAGNGALAGVTKPTNQPELATAAGTIASTVDAQAAALGAIKAPKADKALVAGVVAALAAVPGPARALQEAAGKTDDAATGQAASDLRGKVDAAAVQAKAYGLNGCGAGLQAPIGTILDGGRTVLKAAFVAKAESLCTTANRKADALASPTSLATEAKYMAAYVPIEEKLFNDIKALPKPPGDESPVSDMLAAQDQVIAKDKEILAAAQKGNNSLFGRLNDEEAPLITAANSKFDAYGLRACGTLSDF